MNFRQRFFDSNTLWMMSREHLNDLAARLMGPPIVTPDLEQPEEGQDCDPLYEIRDGVAVIDVEGVIVRKADPCVCEYFGLCSLETVTEAIQQANSDPLVSAIVLNIDSPGGECCGTPEVAALVRESIKPVVAYTAGMMASAAYYIGSQASMVIAAPSAMVGSIGCILTTYDWTDYLSKMGITAHVFTDSPLKGSGSSVIKMTDEQKAYLQSTVDQIGAEFRATVLDKRPGVPPESMQGQCFIGKATMAAGLVDDFGPILRAIQSAKDST